MKTVLLRVLLAFSLASVPVALAPFAPDQPPVYAGKERVCTTPVYGFVPPWLVGTAVDPGPQPPAPLPPFDPSGSVPQVQIQYGYVSADPCYRPPASVTIVSKLESSTCGSSESISVEVLDADGFNVKDETMVSFSTSSGTITSERPTRGGTAIASLQLTSGTSGGLVEVTATAGLAAATRTLHVTCG